jgi:tetratricopeptide (TPR) repeat protein
MKQIFHLLLFICFISSSDVSYAQSKKDKQRDSEKYDAAIELSNRAETAWNKDSIRNAEKLFLESSKTYLTNRGLNQLANLKIKIGDINGANAAWNNMLREAANYDLIITSGDSYISSKKFMGSILQDQGDINAKKGNIQQAYQSYLVFENYVNDAEEFGDKYYTLSIYASQTENFETAQRAIDSLKVFYGDRKNVQKGSGVLSVMKRGLIKKALKKGSSDMQLQVLVAEINLLMALGEYEKAIETADHLEREDNGLNTTWKGVARMAKAECYALIGNSGKAKEFLNLTLKHVAYTRNSPNVRYVMGLIYLLDKEYDKAIENFNGEMNYHSSVFAMNQYSAWGKYRFYTKRADAYMGLKDFSKAKSDYETALLFNPEYKLAISGLAKLEGRVIDERRSDKTPPIIKLTEPSNARGLKVTSTETQVMIKGNAADQSGLKSVTINGNSVYSQEQGDFWGNVALKAGINKVTIRATDISGNTAEQIFEIEKQAVPSTSGNDIVPVNQKESKNYAVIIGAQNYNDPSIPSLENPVSDGVKLKLILKNNYNFSEENIYTLFNPAVTDFKKRFAEMLEVIQPEDNLIIFYAGHGIWVDKEKKGYWLLTDAKRNDANTWLPNKTVLDLIAKLPTRHTLLITDACFSGGVFKTRSLGKDAPAAMVSMNEKISRVAITSGNDTEVPDESVFMKYLVKALSENKDKYLTAQKMFITQIIEAVMTETKTEPRYGTLELAGHVGGDFIFVKK